MKKFALLFMMLFSLSAFAQNTTVFKKLENQDSLSLTEAQKDSAIFYTKFDSDYDGTYEVYQLPFRVLETALDIPGESLNEIEKIQYNSDTVIDFNELMYRSSITHKFKIKEFEKKDFHTIENFTQIPATVSNVVNENVPWRYKGSIPFVAQNNSITRECVTVTTPTLGREAPSMIAEFYTNADSLIFQSRTSDFDFQVIVDDSIYHFKGESEDSTYGVRVTYKIPIPHYDGKHRLIQFNQTLPFMRSFGVNEDKGFSIIKPTYSLTNIIFYGDSYGSSVDDIISYKDLIAFSNPRFNLFVNQEGGTGYISPAGNVPSHNEYKKRIQLASVYDAKIVVFTGGYNDRLLSSSISSELDLILDSCDFYGVEPYFILPFSPAEPVFTEKDKVLLVQNELTKKVPYFNVLSSPINLNQSTGSDDVHPDQLGHIQMFEYVINAFETAKAYETTIQESLHLTPSTQIQYPSSGTLQVVDNGDGTDSFKIYLNGSWLTIATN